MLFNSTSGFRFQYAAILDGVVGKKQCIFPKSKKKRIIKKWAKNPLYFKTFEETILDTRSNTVYVSLKVYNALKNDPLYTTLQYL